MLGKQPGRHYPWNGHRLPRKLPKHRLVWKQSESMKRNWGLGSSWKSRTEKRETWRTETAGKERPIDSEARRWP